MKRLMLTWFLLLPLFLIVVSNNVSAQSCSGSTTCRLGATSCICELNGSEVAGTCAQDPSALGDACGAGGSCACTPWCNPAFTTDGSCGSPSSCNSSCPSGYCRISDSCTYNPGPTSTPPPAATATPPGPTDTPPPGLECTPDSWGVPSCGSVNGCSGCDSSQCKSDGSGWNCVSNPALCCDPGITPPPPVSNTIGGRVTDPSGAGVAGVVIDIYNNSKSGDSTGGHVYPVTNATGYFSYGSYVEPGNGYAVRLSALPAGYSAPLRANGAGGNMGWTWSNCLGSDTPLNSAGYECQTANVNDCGGNYPSGDDRCNFIADPTVGPPLPPGIVTGQDYTSSCVLNSGTATLTWAPAARATSYELRVSERDPANPGAPYNPCGSGNTFDECVNGLTSNSHTINVRGNRSYAWWLRACNSAGCGPYNNVPVLAQFPIFSAPTASSVACNINGTSALISWTIPGVNGFNPSNYTLRVDDQRDPWFTSGSDLFVTQSASSYTKPTTSGVSYGWDASANYGSISKSSCRGPFTNFSCGGACVPPPIPPVTVTNSSSCFGSGGPTGSVAVNWGSGTYSVVRRIGVGAPVVIANSRTASYTDLTASCGLTYSYGVQTPAGACGASAIKWASLPVFVKCNPANPNTPTATQGGFQIIVGNLQTGYNVFADTDTVPPPPPFRFVGTATGSTLNDSGALCAVGSNYYYQAQATRGSGANICTANSPYSPAGNCVQNPNWYQANGDVTAKVNINNKLPAGFTTIGLITSVTVNWSDDPLTNQNVQRAETEIHPSVVTNPGYTGFYNSAVAKAQGSKVSSSASSLDINTISGTAVDGVVYVENNANDLTLTSTTLSKNMVLIYSGPGTVKIAGNISVVAPANTFVLLAKGNIIIDNLVGLVGDPSVRAADLQGIYIAGGTFSDTDEVETTRTLKVDGSVIGLGGVSLDRESSTATYPKDYFVFNPGYVMNLPTGLRVSSRYFTELAP